MRGLVSDGVLPCDSGCQAVSSLISPGLLAHQRYDAWGCHWQLCRKACVVTSAPHCRRRLVKRPWDILFFDLVWLHHAPTMRKVASTVGTNLANSRVTVAGALGGRALVGVAEVILALICFIIAVSTSLKIRALRCLTARLQGRTQTISKLNISKYHVPHAVQSCMCDAPRQHHQDLHIPPCISSAALPLCVELHRRCVGDNVTCHSKIVTQQQPCIAIQ